MDLVAITEDAIKRGICNSETAVYIGHSAGAMLGSCAIRVRPKLFKAAVLGNGSLHMTRYHEAEVGDLESNAKPSRMQIVEYGENNSEIDIFNCDNIDITTSIFMTGCSDDGRVPPVHNRVVVEKLQASKVDAYLYETPTGGHAGWTTNLEWAAWRARAFAFLQKAAGLSRVVHVEG